MAPAQPLIPSSRLYKRSKRIHLQPSSPSITLNNNTWLTINKDTADPVVGTVLKAADTVVVAMAGADTVAPVEATEEVDTVVLLVVVSQR